MDSWSLPLLILVVVAVLFFLSVVAALVWAVKNNQLSNLEKGARTIFNEEEPEGVQQDFFPGKKGRRDRAKHNPPPDLTQP
ncbi:MAG: cbb3-type cytochrome oxidase assembly protein CcoS [Opitutales bacterium]